MRKTGLYVILALFLVLTMSIVTAAEFGCCITPVGLADGSLDNTEDDCTSPNLWIDSCYDVVADVPQFSSDFNTTSCCCYGYAPAYADEAESAEPAKTPADIIISYCSAQDGYVSAPLDDYPEDTTCELTCASPFSNNEHVLLEGIVTNSNNDDVVLSDIDVILELENGDKWKTTTQDGYYNFTDVPKQTANIFLATPINYPYVCELPDVRGITINHDPTIEDFSMSCTLQGGGCIPEWVDYCSLPGEDGCWTDCTPFNGELMQRRLVIDNKDCGYPPSEYYDDMTRTCGETPSGLCNDGVLNINEEQCDIDSDGVGQYLAANGTILTNDFSCARVMGENVFGEGDVTCTPYCTLDISECKPSCNGICDSLEKCGCDICEETEAGRDLCNQECLLLEPTFVPFADLSTDSRNVYDLYSKFNEDTMEEILFPGVSYELRTNDVTLSWDYKTECDDLIMGFKLVSCEEQEGIQKCKSGTEMTNLLYSPTARIGIIENALQKEHTSYCYNVCALTEHGDEVCAYDPGELPCFASGDNICMKPSREEGYNCELVDGFMHPVGCDVGGEGAMFAPLTNLSLDVITCNKTADNEQICVETPGIEVGDKGAACRDVTTCEQCNGLFGLYANYNLPVSVNGEKLTCDEIQFYGTKSTSQQIANNAEEAIGLCFKDETLTPQPLFDTCEKVQSCYAYQSKEACYNDPCMKFQDESRACDWTGFDDELGIGICAPIINKDIECGRCDVDSPLGFCTEEFCQDIYGKDEQICYYNENSIDSNEDKLKETLFRDIQKPIIPSCVNKDNMACYFYDNAYDCEGDSQAEYNVIYDITEDASKDTRESIAIQGDNAQITASEDYFNFGNCYWDEQTERCMKNANDYFFHAENELKKDDCMEVTPTSRELSCFTDNAAPVTTILWKEGNSPVYGVNELANIPIMVVDDKQIQKNIITYFAIDAGNVRTSYPSYELVDFIDAEYGILSELVNGDYTISYFSTDIAKNLEVIRSKQIKIDAMPPDTNVEYHILPQEIGPDRFVSNITVRVTTAEPAHCKIQLFDANNNLVQIAGDKEILETREVSTTYIYIADGTYTLEGFCKDKYNNEDIIDYTIRVDGDKSISDSYPFGDVFKSGFSGANLDDLEFSLETENAAECYVSPNKFEGNLDEELQFKMNSNEDNTAHSIVYSDVSNIDESGTYSYYVKCIFEADGKIVQDKLSDTISFSVDNEPPTAILQKKMDSGEFETYIEIGENWGEIKYFRIACDDSNELTPYGYAGCAQITYCLLDDRDETISSSDLEDECDIITKTGMYTDISISQTEEDLTKYGHKYLYYYATDAFDNQEETVHVAQLRIRNTVFGAPNISVS